MEDTGKRQQPSLNESPFGTSRKQRGRLRSGEKRLVAFFCCSINCSRSS
jgi:hypothetical protein